MLRTAQVSCFALLLASALGCSSASDDPAKSATTGGAGGGGGSGGSATGGSSTGGGDSGGSGGAPKVDVVRDARGVPHIYASDLESAMYGLGWATAEDRLFQMDFSRRWTRGSLAEWFGAGDAGAIVQMDRYQRVLGFRQFAEQVVDQLPTDVRAVLEAYARGVNDFVARPEFTLPPGYASIGVQKFDPWTPADSLLAWDRLTQIFGGNDMDGELEQLAQCRSPQGCVKDPSCPSVIDEAAAIVPDPSLASNADAEWTRPDHPMKASHAWVVSGKHTTTGLPVLHSDPQTLVRAPSVWYEWHVSAGDVDARGVGVAGAPVFLIFWNQHIAQGLTAAGGDVTDLFQIEPTSDGKGYVVDGQVEPFSLRSETIQVKGGAPVSFDVQTTRFGPVVNSLTKADTGGALFAQRHVNLWKQDDHSVVGALRMLQAKNLTEYRAALEHWFAPGANALYADAEGHTAYHPLIAIPKRAPHAAYPGWHGRVPQDGTKSANDWGAALSADERPHVIDPAQGYLFSGNHLSVGKWFPYYTGLAGTGDTDRSLRLRFLLAQRLHKAPGAGPPKPWDPVDPASKMTPEDVLAIHTDAGSDIVRLYRDALDVLDKKGLLGIANGAEAGKAQAFLGALKLWKNAFDNSDPLTPAARWVAGNTPGKFRAQHYPEVACKWGGAQGGLSFFLKSFEQGLVDPSQEAKKFLIETAAAGWDAVSQPGEPSTWTAPTKTFSVEYQVNFFCKLDASLGGCALDSTQSFPVSLVDDVIGSIWSQAGNSYSQWVNLADVEGSKAILPPGVSEDPASATFKINVEAWKSGTLAPAPMSRAAVDVGAMSTTKLSYTK